MRVLVVEPDPGRRAALREVLETEPDLQIVAERPLLAGDARVRLEPVDVVVIDERVVGSRSSGTWAALSARALVVVVGDGHSADREAAAAAARAVGYWPHGGDDDALIALVRAAGLVARADHACTVQRRRHVEWFRERRRVGAPA